MRFDHETADPSAVAVPSRQARASRSTMGLMQVPRKIEYALRAMIFLAECYEGTARGAEIAAHEQIPRYFLEKVVRDLTRAGLVQTRRGPGGGYQLGRPPETISFREIIEAVEGPITLNICLESASVCSLQPACRMYRVWQQGQKALLDVFSRANLKDIVASHPGPATDSPGPFTAL